MPILLRAGVPSIKVQTCNLHRRDADVLSAPFLKLLPKSYVQASHASGFSKEQAMASESEYTFGLACSAPCAEATEP